jgi:NADH-quinone oxidoreductase subunit F
MICTKEKIAFPEYIADGNCPVDFCKKIMKSISEQTCGEDVLCREGTLQVFEVLDTISQGHPEEKDYELLLEILNSIKKYGSCASSRGGAEICINIIEECENEVDKHINRKVCTNLICTGCYTLYIDPAICDGCGECIKACDYESILGKEGYIHVINTKKCIKCGECITVCPKEAVKKAGTIKPEISTEPVPVGSFSQDGGNEGGNTGRRRRRRG